MAKERAAQRACWPKSVLPLRHPSPKRRSSRAHDLQDVSMTACTSSTLGQLSTVYVLSSTLPALRATVGGDHCYAGVASDRYGRGPAVAV